jgi:hypothetical protein
VVQDDRVFQPGEERLTNLDGSSRTNWLVTASYHK